MFRAKILVPVLAIGAGLFLMAAPAKADFGVTVRFGNGYPAPVYRPAPPVFVPPVIAPVPYPVYQPAPVVVVPPQPHCYRVMYRDCAHGPWQTYQVFHNPGRANDTVAHLRHRGLEAYIAYQ